MADENINWRLWAEGIVRELNGLRCDINRHLTEHREDIKEQRDAVVRIEGRINDLTDKFSEMTSLREKDHRDRDEKQNDAIASLKTEIAVLANGAGKEAGHAAGKDAGKDAGKGEGTKWGLIASGIVIAIYQILQFIASNLPAAH